MLDCVIRSLGLMRDCARVYIFMLDNKNLPLEFDWLMSLRAKVVGTLEYGSLTKRINYNSQFL